MATNVTQLQNPFASLFGSGEDENILLDYEDVTDIFASSAAHTFYEFDQGGVTNLDRTQSGHFATVQVFDHDQTKIPSATSSSEPFSKLTDLMTSMKT